MSQIVRLGHRIVSVLPNTIGGKSDLRQRTGVYMVRAAALPTRRAFPKGDVRPKGAGD